MQLVNWKLNRRIVQVYHFEQHSQQWYFSKYSSIHMLVCCIIFINGRRTNSTSFVMFDRAFDVSWKHVPTKYQKRIHLIGIYEWYQLRNFKLFETCFFGELWPSFSNFNEHETSQISNKNYNTRAHCTRAQCLSSHSIKLEILLQIPIHTMRVMPLLLSNVSFQ